jgi:hypothetical protein
MVAIISGNYIKIWDSPSEAPANFCGSELFPDLLHYLMRIKL